MQTKLSFSDTLDQAEVVSLYAANGWTSAEKPVPLLAALRNSHSLVTARLDGRLVGLVRREDVDAVEHRVDAG